MNVSASGWAQISTIFPSLMRWMCEPLTDTSRPVGSLPRNGPVLVPRKRQRVTTLSPSAI
jgi:hypothetical protein